MGKDKELKITFRKGKIFYGEGVDDITQSEWKALLNEVISFIKMEQR